MVRRCSLGPVIARRARQCGVLFGWLCLLASASPAVAQTCPPVVLTAPSQTITISVRVHDGGNNPGTCTVTSGGYVKANRLYKLHLAAVLTGSCQTRTWHLGQCVNVTVVERYLSGTQTYTSAKRD